MPGRFIYRIDHWRERQDGDLGWEADVGKSPRWGFEGESAPEMAHLLHRSVKHWYLKGDVGVARYVNC